MRAIEDTLNTAVLGHFLIIIGTLCFGVISAAEVRVKYQKCQHV
jgi:hypothetical protein